MTEKPPGSVPRWVLRCIAVYEVVGGLFGIGAVVLGRQLFHGNLTGDIWTAKLILRHGFALVLSIASITAGVLLWSGSRVGVRTSIVVQAVQAFNWRLLGIRYAASLGAGVFIAVHPLSFDLETGAFWYVFLRGGGEWYFGVNVVALLILGLLVAPPTKRDAG